MIRIISLTLLILLLIWTIPALAQATGWERLQTPGYNNRSAAQTMHQTAHDPLENIKKYFNELKQVNDYFSGFNTMHARFTQTAGQNRGSHIALGEMLIKRPGKTRWDYASPNAATIIINDGDMVYYDRELDEVTYTEIPDTPLSLMLQKKISLFDPKISITNVEKQNDSLLVSVRRADASVDNIHEQLTLTFALSPIQLYRIESTDMNNQTTTIQLNKLQFNMPLSDDEFIFNAFEERPKNNRR